MPAPDLQHAQDAALKVFRRWNDTPGAVVIDTETTGLNGGVWNLSAAALDSGQPVLDVVCNPLTPWEDRAREMHAAHLGSVGRAPLAEARRAEVQRALNAPLLLAYHARFDQGAVLRTWPGLELPAFGCVMTAYAPLAGQWSDRRSEWKWVTLAAALAAEGQDVSDLPDAHSATGDVMRTVRLIRAVAARADQSAAAKSR